MSHRLDDAGVMIDLLYGIAEDIDAIRHEMERRNRNPIAALWRRFIAIFGWSERSGA